MIAYVDTSALVKKVFRESDAELVDLVWDTADTRLASELVYTEARAAAAAGHRAGRFTDDDLREAVDEIERLCASLDMREVDRDVARTAGNLAEAHGLRAYDAVHLAVAVGSPARRVVVATWDRDLAKASTAHGLAVVPGQQELIQAGEPVLR
jgi:predicted nucleic acid-binding protein